MDVSFRDEIVELFDRYIKHVRIPVITLSGTVEERLNKFYSTIKEYEQ